MESHDRIEQIRSTLVPQRSFESESAVETSALVHPALPLPFHVHPWVLLKESEAEGGSVSQGLPIQAPMFVQNLEERVVAVGAPARFKCIVTGYPQPTIQWCVEYPLFLLVLGVNQMAN